MGDGGKHELLLKRNHVGLEVFVRPGLASERKGCSLDERLV